MLRKKNDAYGSPLEAIVMFFFSSHLRVDILTQPNYGVNMTPKIGIFMITAKNERITARVSEQVKDTLTIAADLVGATLNQFLIQSALEKAENIIEKDKIIRLSNKDAQVFFNALDNPPEPNIKLKNAFESYRNKIG